jgi:hypothetical protein
VNDFLVTRGCRRYWVSTFLTLEISSIYLSEIFAARKTEQQTSWTAFRGLRRLTIDAMDFGFLGRLDWNPKADTLEA